VQLQNGIAMENNHDICYLIRTATKIKRFSLLHLNKSI